MNVKNIFTVFSVCGCVTPGSGLDVPDSLAVLRIRGVAGYAELPGMIPERRLPRGNMTGAPDTVESALRGARKRAADDIRRYNVFMSGGEIEESGIKNILADPPRFDLIDLESEREKSLKIMEGFGRRDLVIALGAYMTAIVIVGLIGLTTGFILTHYDGQTMTTLQASNTVTGILDVQQVYTVGATRIVPNPQDLFTARRAEDGTVSTWLGGGSNQFNNNLRLRLESNAQADAVDFKVLSDATPDYIVFRIESGGSQAMVDFDGGFSGRFKWDGPTGGVTKAVTAVVYNPNGRLDLRKDDILTINFRAGKSTRTRMSEAKAVVDVVGTVTSVFGLIPAGTIMNRRLGADRNMQSDEPLPNTVFGLIESPSLGMYVFTIETFPGGIQEKSVTGMNGAWCETYGNVMECALYCFYPPCTGQIEGLSDGGNSYVRYDIGYQRVYGTGIQPTLHIVSERQVTSEWGGMTLTDSNWGGDHIVSLKPNSDNTWHTFYVNDALDLSSMSEDGDGPL